jgi:hypothetical protein
MDVDLDFRNVPLPSFGGKQSRTDLFTVARLVMDLPSNWSVVLRGDVGGFGIGGSSDLSAHGVLNSRWNFQRAWNLIAGYRALCQD